MESSELVPQYIDELNNSIKRNDWEMVTRWLQYLRTEFKNISLCVKLGPKMNTISQLQKFFYTVKEKINRNFLTDLQFDLKHLVSQSVIDNHSGQILIPEVKFKLRRKNQLLFCYSNSCLRTASIYRIQDLISISCCPFHTFCRSCLTKCITDSLEKGIYNKIRCPACEATGSINLNYMKTSEIKELIPAEIYNEFFNNEIYKIIMVTCESRMFQCPNKNRLLYRKRVLDFVCGDKICKECYAISVEEQINNSIELLIKDPETFCDEPIGMKCPNMHITSLKEYTLDELNEILRFSTSNENTKRNIMQKLEKYYEYLSGFPMGYCKNCNLVTVIYNQDQQDCQKCLRCLKCKQQQHPYLTCSQFKELLSQNIRYGGLRQRPVETDKDFRLFIQAVETLKRFSSVSGKIENYEMITPAGLKQHHFDQISQFFHSIKTIFLIGFLYANEIECKKQLVTQMPTDMNNGLTIFPKKIELVENTVVVMFKVVYCDEIILRKPNPTDKDETPKLFLDYQQYYLSNDKAAIPVMILHIGLSE